jgi:glycosyltransferase involved in cell wall biosynthesis
MTTAGLLDGLIFPSADAEAWWLRAIASSPRASLADSLPHLRRVVHWGVPRWRAAAITAALDDGAARAALRADFGWALDDFVFLTFSTFQLIKGHAGIFKAFARAQLMCAPLELRLAAIGRRGFFPPDMDWVYADPTIALAGPTTRTADYLAMADAYVSNTQGGGETWGLSTLAALAAGRPVLASDAGATAELMEDGVSALVHHVPTAGPLLGDVERDELAQHMCDVAANATLYARLSEAGAARARDFGHAHLERALADVFARLLAPAQQARKVRDN